MIHHKVLSLCSVVVILVGVRFVETVFYVFHKVLSLCSVRWIPGGMRFVETVFYVFHKVHSLSSKSKLFPVRGRI